MQVMLAGKYDPDKIRKILPVYGQVKLDGIRAYIEDGYARTRSTKPVRSQQAQSFVSHNKHLLEGLDGEFICGDPTAKNCYNRTDSSVMSFNKPDDYLTYYVFDMWDSVGSFQERWDDILSMNFSVLEARVKLVDTRLLWTIEEIDQFMDEMIALGHEGIILRNPNSYYKNGRGTPVQGELIKRKDGRWIDTEAMITGVKELRSNQNEATVNALGYTERSSHQENLIPQGVLGAVEVIGKFPEEDTLDRSLWNQEYTTSIGTGFDDQMRMELWQNPPISKMVKFKFFSGGVKDKPRFPVFLGFRDADDMDPPKQMELF
jgi:DNA ligase 1